MYIQGCDSTWRLLDHHSLNLFLAPPLQACWHTSSASQSACTILQWKCSVTTGRVSSACEPETWSVRRLEPLTFSRAWKLAWSSCPALDTSQILRAWVCSCSPQSNWNHIPDFGMASLLGNLGGGGSHLMKALFKPLSGVLWSPSWVCVVTKKRWIVARKGETLKHKPNQGRI